MSQTKWTHSVPQPELALMLVYSFRYALGRMSTGPSAVADLLARYGHVLPDWQRDQICGDIAHAIEGDAAGHDCDVAVWREVADRMRALKGKP